MQFSFNASDNFDIVLSCSLVIDEQRNLAISAIRGVTTTLTVGNLSEGLHNWKVVCTDSAGLRSESNSNTFTMDNSVPSIEAVNFANTFTGEQVILTVNVTSVRQLSSVKATIPTVAQNGTQINSTISLSFDNNTLLFTGTFAAPPQPGTYISSISAANIIGGVAIQHVPFTILLGVDLVIEPESISILPLTPFTGSITSVTALVKNIGNRDAFNVNVSLSSLGQNLSSVKINVSANGTTTVVLPWDTKGFAGNVQISIRALGIFTESNSSNNIALKTFFVDGHDLSVTSISFIPASPVFSGETVGIIATIRNNINATADSIRVNFYEGTVDLDHLIGFSDIVSINGSTQKTSSINWQTAGLLGNRTIIVEVNPQNFPAEVERTNNRANTTFELTRFVAEQIPDLITFLKTPLLNETNQSIRGITSNDFTGDGKIDFAIVTNSGNLVLYENNITSVSEIGNKNIVVFNRNQIVNLGEFTQGLASADFQFDNFPDIIVGTLSGKVYLFRNTNGIIPQNGEVIFDAGDDVYGLTIGDVDNDNDFDIITGNRIGHVDFFINKGPNTLIFEFNKTITTRDKPYGLTTGDYDLDGHIDMMIGDRLGQLERIVFESNNYNGFLFADIGEFAHGLTTADIDYSGKLDLFALGFNGNINLYYSREGGLVAEPLIVGNKRESSGLSSGDYDRDNDIDLIVGSNTGEITYFENSLRIQKSFSPLASPPLRPIQIFTNFKNPYARQMINVTLQEKLSENLTFVQDSFRVDDLNSADLHFYDTSLDTPQSRYHFYLNLPSTVFVKRCSATGECGGAGSFIYSGTADIIGNSITISNVLDIFNHMQSIYLREGFSLEYIVKSMTPSPQISAKSQINYTLLGLFNTQPTSFLLSDDVSNLNDQLANSKNINPLPYKNDKAFAEALIRIPDFTPIDIIFRNSDG